MTLAVYAATLAAFLAATSATDTSATDIVVTTTVNDTHCIAGSNVGTFYHFGAAYAIEENKGLAIQYEAENVTCCSFEFENGANADVAEISKVAGAKPCSNLAECKTNGNCDENAICVMAAEGAFKCQCTELYEGDGTSCSRKPHWSEWSAFGPYSKSCGDGATRTRTRTCSKPPRCNGENTNSETRDLDPCPIPTTTTLPPTRYLACGTRKCKNCPGGYSGCNNKGLDRDKDKEDLKSCPSGYRHVRYKEYWQFIVPNVWLNICASLPPKPIAKYRYEMCGAVNCIGCDQERCQNQSQKHLEPAAQVADSAQCSEGYSDLQGSDNDTFRVCRSNQKFSDPWALP